MNRLGPRAIAARVLQRRAGNTLFTEELLAREPGVSGLSAPDRALAQELTYGVVRWQSTLDWLIARKTAGRTQKIGLQILLRLGLYQLFWLERVPDHAAVHETVALTKTLGFGPQAGFVNAVLRGYLREREATRALLGALREEQPALGWSHPEWLFARWEARWGRGPALSLLQWNNRPPRTFARVNTLKTSPERLLDLWKAEGVVAEPAPNDWTPSRLTYLLLDHPPVVALPSFQNGLFYVQDPSTLLAVHELDPQPGERVLDLCAAPGGKTTYIAQCMADRGEIVAHDLHPDRLRLVEENCARLRVRCVRTTPELEPRGAGQAASENQVFDRLLLDAPCSNTGVMRRRVDLRWRLRPEELVRLQQAQLALLRQGAALLKTGGTLVYSTCSLEPEENGTVVRRFLAQHPEFRVRQERELTPFGQGFDGAYVARLSKAGASRDSSSTADGQSKPVAD